jgi:multicomponent Na+:H+ antiporter subunit F
LVEIILDIAIGFMGVAIVLVSLRLILGPTIADRILALDSLTIISISLIVIIALFSDRVIYLDVAMVYAVISFAGVVAAARYIEGGL